MARGLDHIVHAVSDLERAAELYRRLGFFVGARNRHPWGTDNHVVQLPGFFIELLTVAEPERLQHDAGHAGLARNFGAFNRSAIARGDGFSFLMLESVGIDSDVVDFARHAIGRSGASEFSREAKRPDGTPATVGFSLAFAADAMSPHTGFAVCQQHNPEAFWNASFQIHENGACGVLGAVLVADNPTDHHIFLTAFTGVRELHSTSIGITAHTPRGDVEIIEPVSFRDRFGVTLSAKGEGATLGGLRLAVDRLDTVRAGLTARGISFHENPGNIAVGPETALGATLVFEQAADH